MVKFTTTDGVSVAIGDYYWYIARRRARLKLYGILINSGQDLDKGIVQFSTKEKALEYMYQHRTVIMIPARMNSKRIPKKNIRLLNGKPLIAYSIELALRAKNEGLVDEVYVNSEDEIFAGLCKEYGIEFYQRDPRFSADDVQNDWFAQDFFMNVPCKKMIQILPTSPFIAFEDLRGFIDEMNNQKYDTLVSLKNVRIECLYQGSPINFMKSEITKPSQSLTAVQAYACALMGWRKEVYLSNMHIGGAYHGFTGNTGYYLIDGYATVDIDTEGDFQLAEHIAQKLEKPSYEQPAYYEPSIQNGVYQVAYNVIEVNNPGNQELRVTNSENDVTGILRRDGVSVVDLHHVNKMVQNVLEIIDNNPKSWSWAKRLVNSASNSATLISQWPGEGNRMHYHPDWDEWWYIVSGSYEFEIGGHKQVTMPGDLVFIQRGIVHKITAVGDKAAVRLAVSRDDVRHVYVEMKTPE